MGLRQKTPFNLVGQQWGNFVDGELGQRAGLLAHQRGVIQHFPASIEFHYLIGHRPRQAQPDQEDEQHRQIEFRA